MPFLRITIYSIIGIYLTGIYDINLYLPALLLLILGICMIVVNLFDRFNSWNFTGVIALVFFICLGAFAQKVQQLSFCTDHFSQYSSDQSKLLVKITSVKSGYFSKYVGNVDLVCKGDSCQRVSGRILVKSPDHSLSKGDVILVEGGVSEFPVQENKYAFDQNSFYANKGIFHHTFSKNITLLQPDESLLNKYREKLRSKIDSLSVSRRVQSVITAMILGDKSDLNEVEGIFRKTGTSHVLAISGLHVGIIATLIFYLLSFMPPSTEKVKYLIVIILVWLFCLLSGGMPSTIRSSVMLSCFLVGKTLGRNGLSYNYCFAAAFFMLLRQPGLIYDVGFQFSFSAIIGILYFYEPIYKALQFKGRLNYCWQLISMSMAAQLMITPLSLYYFHEFPLLFLLTSLIAIPSTFIVIAFSLASIILSYDIFDFLMLDYFLNWFVESFLSLLQIFAQNDALVLSNLFPDKLEIALYYALVFSISIFFRHQLNRYLYIFVFSFFLLVSYQFKVNHELSNTCLVVYANEDAVMVDVINAGAVMHFYEEGIKSSQANWVASNIRTKFKVTKQKDIEIHTDSNQVLTIGRFKVGIMNRPELDQSICDANLLLVNTVLSSEILAEYGQEIIDFGDNAIPNAQSNKQFIKYIN